MNLKAIQNQDLSKTKGIESIEKLIQGYKSPLGMELISIVHYCAKQSNTTSPDKIFNCMEE